MPDPQAPRRFLAVTTLLFFASVAAAQARLTPFTLERAVGDPSLREHLPETAWVPGSAEYSRLDPLRRQQVTLHRPGEGEGKTAFTAAQLAAALGKAGAKARLRGIPTFRWQDAKTVRVQLPEGVFAWTPGGDGARRVLPLPEDAEPLAVSGDDSRAAYVRDHQLFVQVGDAAPMQLTRDGSEDIVYGGAAHRAEFGIHDGLWWDPTGRVLAFYREDMTPITPYPYVDHTVMPPKALHGRYPMAGRTHSVVRVGVYDTGSGSLHWLEAEPDADVYWTNVTFDPRGEKIYVALVNRGQDTMHLVRFDAATGKRERTLFTENDEQWIEPEHGPAFVAGRSDRFLWFSPRDGFRHLYLYDSDGKLLRQVTKGRFDVQELLRFGPGGAHVFCMASGTDPLQMHLWRVGLADGTMQQLTTERGWHSCDVHPGGALVIDKWSNIELPGRMRVLDTETGKGSDDVRIGHRFATLGKQELITVKAGDGTPLHGMVILPPDLDAGADRKYPLLVYVYGGPHSQLVQDRFLGGASTWLHWMATQGYVVCTLDNRGTDNRGIGFAQSVFRHLAELETEDQLAMVKQLLERPYIDRARVGVHGWSYGGYMTLNLLLRAPGVFRCGIAGAPVTDWAQYETGYTERYMDTPAENPEGYAGAAVLPLAGQLRDRLLVIHGTDDKTVMWSHSIAFVDKCIAAGTLVDYLPYPMHKHGIQGFGPRLHLYRTMTRYFADHLQPGR